MGEASLEVSTLFGEGAKDVLSSVTTKEREFVPGYLENCSYTTLIAGLGQPLYFPGRIAAPAGEGEAQDQRYERFSRVVLVLDYKKTTAVKKILQMVAMNNLEAVGLDSSQLRMLATKQLTEEQKADPKLDVIAGFIVMDRSTRIIVLEGLRDGGIRKVVNEIGLGHHANTKRWKALYHPEVGFSQRLYLDFDLCLKQIKLRQSSLDVLMQRADLYDSSRSEPEVLSALQCLMEMKRAERIHVLKAKGFPIAASLVAIETQYGDFVTSQELEGGCLGDDHSEEASKDTRQLSKGSQDLAQQPGQVPAGGAGDQTIGMTEAMRMAQTGASDDEDADKASVIEQVTVKRSRIIMKGDTVASNDLWTKTLQERDTKDCSTHNKTVLATKSEENAKKHADTLKKKLESRGHCQCNDDLSFLEGQEVHMYSGQKLNSAELQKRAMRKEMAAKEHLMLWTYSPEYNSGCFPMLEKDITLGDVLRASTEFKQEREPFRYPKPRPSSEYSKPDRSVSDSRKWEMQNVPWIENEFEGKVGVQRETIFGAFDPKSLGGQNISRTRRGGINPGSSAAAEAATLKQEQLDEAKALRDANIGPRTLAIASKPPQDKPSLVDKYYTDIRHTEAQHHGLKFSARKVPREIAKKFGKGKPVPNVQPPPASMNNKEEFREDQMTSAHPFNLSRLCAKSIEPPCPGVYATASSSVYMNMTRAPLTAREKLTDTRFRMPQLSAR